jgi:AcrR family transcriptional regulator
MRKGRCVARPARSTQEVEEVREEILRHAAEILCEEGYPGLSMAKIGARMGMTSPNVYNYFANKEHVYLEIHNRAFGMLYERMRSAVEGAENPSARVRELIKTYVDFGLQNDRYYEIMFCIHTPKYSDYVGTPLEGIAMEARRLSFQALEFAYSTVKEASASISNSGDEEIGLLTVQNWVTLHGLISLYNNRILVAAVDESEAMIEEIIARILRSLGVSPGQEKTGEDISCEREERDGGI